MHPRSSNPEQFGQCEDTTSFSKTFYTLVTQVTHLHDTDRVINKKINMHTAFLYISQCVTGDLSNASNRMTLPLF